MKGFLARLFAIARRPPPAPQNKPVRTDVDERRAVRKAARLERTRWATVLQDPQARRNIEFAVVLLQNSEMSAESIVECLGRQLPYRPIGTRALAVVDGGADHGSAA